MTDSNIPGASNKWVADQLRDYAEKLEKGEMFGTTWQTEDLGTRGWHVHIELTIPKPG